MGDSSSGMTSVGDGATHRSGKGGGVTGNNEVCVEAGQGLQQKHSRDFTSGFFAPVVLQEAPKYRKSVLRKGDKRNFPQKGDTVACFYTGKLQDGTVFDTNVVTGTCEPRGGNGPSLCCVPSNVLFSDSAQSAECVE